MQSNRLMRFGAWFVLSIFTTTSTWAGTNTLADSPLVSGLAKVISPNIFFILDDSGSMDREFMPEGIDGNSGKACYRNFGYNTIYYNPTITYDRPVDETGALLAQSDFNNAWVNGFNHSAGTRDLASTLPVYGDVTVALPGTGAFTTYLYTGTTNQKRRIVVSHPGHGFSTGTSVKFTGTPTSGNLNVVPWTSITNQTFNITKIDNDRYYFSTGTAANASVSSGAMAANVTYTGIVGSTPEFYYYNYKADIAAPPTDCSHDDSDYDKVVPSLGTAAEKQNFANWYSYYRKRLLMMKSASGRAFTKLTDKYRVGFTVISDSGMGSNFLALNKYDATQKSNWYKTLYGISANSYTPLRAALSKAGRYYAGTLSGAEAGSKLDPVQYSCQQNYTILTTDGYWNDNTESGSYGPFKEDNTTKVGDVDGSLSPPQYDAKKISNTLADVAAYYYYTDLRPTAGNGGITDEGQQIDVSTNNVPTSTSDTENHQHMTTFTLGLGVNGKLKPPDANGNNDLDGLIQGTKQWPNPITSGEAAERIDDLWHAAVNGHGSYLSAKSPDEVEKGLGDMLLKIQARKGAASAAATSNLQPVAGGDNIAFIAQYQTVTWVGDLLAREVDPTTGAISGTDLWSAQAKLDTLVDATSDNRKIFTFSSAASNKLKPFDATNLATEISAGYFKTSQLSQEGGWSSDQKTAATATALINYLRGQNGNEQTGGSKETDLFRDRQHVLGDIASAAPVFVGKPPFSYLDTGYAAFLSANKSRAGVVYVGSNDGMLHAIDGSKSGGTELWAYVPSMVIPNLHRLADEKYQDNHRFFVDGPIYVGDAYNGSSWSTILIGGLGHGGRGYYALDVTDPANPKALWEFSAATNPNLGYSYGNPILTKRASDGKWVVMFASGYNNSEVDPKGDGKGRLFVLDAFTGTELTSIVTKDPSGTSVNDEQRSGIARVSNYVENGLTDNVTQYVYGGDLDGALWRFDITASSNVGASQLLGRTVAAGTKTQPITVQPELARIRDGAGTWHRVVFFGTGRYLGPNDVTNSEPSNGKSQGIYAVMDTGSSLGVFSSVLKEQKLANTTPRTISPVATVDWQTEKGWFVTTPSVERFNVDPGLQLGTLVIASNIPEQDYCSSTGKSVLYQLDYKTGNILKVNEFTEQIVGITQLQTRGGAGPVVIDPVFGDGTTGNTTQVGGGGGLGGVTRVSWREVE